MKERWGGLLLRKLLLRKKRGLRGRGLVLSRLNRQQGLQLQWLSDHRVLGSSILLGQ